MAVKSGKFAKCFAERSKTLSKLKEASVKLNIIYITAKDKDEARKIGKELLKSRLAACVNIIEKMNSLYWWEGKLQDDTECVLIAKTKQSLVKKLVKKVKSIHSYSCPCVISLPIIDGNKEFLDWIEKETS